MRLASLPLVLTLAVAALPSGYLSASAGAASQDTTPNQASGQPGQATGQAAQAPKQNGTQAGDPGAALDFLGSYSAPQAVLATETGHTSSRPPSATTDERLTELASDLGKVPLAPADLRSWLDGMLTAPDHSPEDWFRIGTAALEAARADSRRLAEIAPSSAWNERLEAGALAGRYPALARSVWNGKAPESTPSFADEARLARRATISLPDARDELERFDRFPESPENLYRRARLLVNVSEEAFRRASVSPQIDARLYALQALADEDENDEGGALAKYQSGLTKYPESALLHAGLGHLYRERNDLDAARGQLAEAWRLDATDALVGFELGDVDLRMGQPAEALSLLNQALSLDPNLLVARWARGRAYLAVGGAGSDRRALEDLAAAESCDSSGVLELQIAQVDAKLGRTAEARDHRHRSEEQRLAAEQAKHGATPGPN